MANTAKNVAALGINAITFTAITTSGVDFDISGVQDEKVFILINATASDAVTISAGTGLFKGPAKKYDVTSGVSVIAFEPGAHRIVSGGKITLTADTASKFSAAVVTL